MASSSQHAPKGPPYASQMWRLGSPPTPIPDVPIDSVFLALFFILGGTSMRIFIMNKKRGHWFIFNALIFGLSLSRVIANAMRIALAYRPDNARLAIATQVFVAAGVLILFITNNFFAQRILRARHPRLAWSKVVTYYPLAIVITSILHIAMIITAIVSSSYSRSPYIHRIDRSLIIYVTIVFAVIAFFPIIVVLTALAIPMNGRKLDDFGKGKLSTKVALVLFTSTLLTLGAAFRAGTTALPPTPLTEARPWYFSKACFYIFDFSIEIVCGALLVYGGMDKRFHVPNEAKHTQTYNLEAARECREQRLRKSKKTKDAEKGATLEDKDLDLIKVKTLTQAQLREANSDMSMG